MTLAINWKERESNANSRLKSDFKKTEGAARIQLKFKKHEIQSSASEMHAGSKLFYIQYIE